MQMRRDVQSLLAQHGVPTSEEAISPSTSDDASTCIVGGLLHAWAQAAGDPAHGVATWLWRGAPAGLNAEFTEIADTLERVPPDATLSPDALESCPSTFSNHGAVDTDPAAIEVIDGYVKQGWLAEFASHAELAAYVGGEPILKKFALLLKEKWDASTGNGLRRSDSSWIVRDRL